MREIKFRAWDELNKRMIYDYFWVGSDGNTWRDQDPHGLDMSGRKKIGPTDKLYLMQYTGLKDKNGKEIYDGDILKSFSPSVPCYEVFYDRCCFWLRYKLKNGDYYDWGPLYRMEEIFHEDRLKFHPEVIGNIYQNPELLTNPPLPKE